MEQLTMFGIPVYGKYGAQLGLLFLVTWAVIYVSIVYLGKLLPRKKKTNRSLSSSSTSLASNSSEDGQNTKKSYAGSDFHENDASNSHTLTSSSNGIIGEANSSHGVPLKWEQLSEQKMLQKSKEFYEFMDQRRSVRMFSKEKIPRKIIENIIITAGTSPSGANQQPWTFVLVENAEKKAAIRRIIEAEEEINYKNRMGDRWVEALRHLNINWIKPYLTDAPFILLIFKQTHSINEDGTRQVHYYSELGVSIATGILFAAIHNAGLVSIVSTPMNCGRSLGKLLERPLEERLLFVMPIGYPAIDCTVPLIKRKPLEKIYVHH